MKRQKKSLGTINVLKLQKKSEVEVGRDEGGKGSGVQVYSTIIHKGWKGLK